MSSFGGSEMGVSVALPGLAPDQDHTFRSIFLSSARANCTSAPTLTGCLAHWLLCRPHFTYVVTNYATKTITSQ